MFHNVWFDEMMEIIGLKNDKQVTFPEIEILKSEKVFAGVPISGGDNLPIHDVHWSSMHYPGYLFGALLHGFKSRPHYHSHYPAYGRYGPYGYHGHAASVVRWGCGKIICRLYNHNLGYIQFEQLPGEQFQKQGMMTFSCKWSLVIFTWKP